MFNTSWRQRHGVQETRSKLPYFIYHRCPATVKVRTIEESGATREGTDRHPQTVSGTPGNQTEKRSKGRRPDLSKIRSDLLKLGAKAIPLDYYLKYVRGQLHQIKKYGFHGHHIHPRCLGGSDLQENFVYLTDRQHIQAHERLAKAFPNHAGLGEAADLLRANLPQKNTLAWSAVRQTKAEADALRKEEEFRLMMSRRRFYSCTWRTIAKTHERWMSSIEWDKFMCDGVLPDRIKHRQPEIYLR